MGGGGGGGGTYTYILIEVISNFISTPQFRLNVFVFGDTVHWTEPLVTRKEMFYLTTHSTHFIYGYMASDIW